MPNKSRIEDNDIPKHLKKAGKKKPYGIEYFRGYGLGGWTSHSWYPTAKARDQAYDNLMAKTDSLPNTMRSEVRKVER